MDVVTNVVDMISCCRVGSGRGCGPATESVVT